MTIFWPTNAFVSVDLPALGRPTMEAKPDRKRGGVAGVMSCRSYERFDGCAGKRPLERPMSVSFRRLCCETSALRRRASQLGHRDHLAAEVSMPDCRGRLREITQDVEIGSGRRSSGDNDRFEPPGAG
jgi:hypothetical protein